MSERVYYEWSSHKTLASAEASLEDDYNTGMICAAEAPYIERRKRANGTVRYCVMFPGE